LSAIRYKFVTHILLIGLIIGSPNLVLCQKDTIVKKEYCYNANLNAGYHYGFIQGYTFDNSFPDQLFITDGNAGIKLWKIPFQIEYRLASIRVPYGLNNYFRIRFDAEKYLSDLEKKKQQLEKLRKVNIDTLLVKRQSLTKKLLYRQYKISELIKLNRDSLNQLIPDSSLLNQYTQLQVPDLNLPDSLQLPNSNLPNWKKNRLTDSLQQLTTDYNSYLNKLNRLNNTIDSLKHFNAKLDALDSLRMNPKDRLEREAMKRAKEKFRLHSFELGTCFPNNSYLMYGTLPVNGVFSEFEVKKVYVSLLYGEVMNNFLFASTFFERQLLSTQNVTNFFDFNNTNKGRKVTALKVGKGTFNGNHVHLGFLLGLGLKNYGDTTLITDVNLQPKESNAVVELSSRYQLKKHEFEFAMAKSMLADHRSGELFSNLGKVDDYSFAGLLTYSTSLFKDRTRVKVLAKHLQPYNRSFGLGFTNNDFLRLNLRIDHQLTKKIKVGGFVKNDMDNLYNLVSFTNSILNYGINTGIRIGRYLNIKATYNPIIQKITDNTNGTTIGLNNYLYNANISYNKRIKKTNLQSVVSYNYFQLNDINLNRNEFQNLILTNTIMVRKTSVSLVANYFTTNIVDSLDRNNCMVSLNVNFPIKKVLLKAGLKYYSNLSGTEDYGAMAGCRIPIYKGLALNLDAQKFVVADYFLSTNLSLENKMPYCFSASFNYSF